ncbi:MAG TPA: sugar phosphate isomerase/epimerase [Bryobacteraceae bacterium]|nr:sugar phosphate isomerase/epimerase [Bryobacteraceae bacterium]
MQNMKSISRRGFLHASTIGLAASGYLHANPLGLPIGCQTWPVRQTIGKDLDGTLHDLAAMGFERIELCSPPGYTAMGFGPLAAMKPAELREKIKAAGLGCESCHFGFTELRDHFDERLAWAQEMGLKQMIISTFWLPKDAKMADWTHAVDDANKFGERTRKAGVQLGFHNHDFEFHKIDGELIYDKLMSEFDPQAVKMQFQVNVISLGYNAADYFEKYPGRFISIHLQDWSPTTKKDVALGRGSVDWKRLWTAAKQSGAKNYFVEVDRDDLKASAQFLKGLN